LAEEVSKLKDQIACLTSTNTTHTNSHNTINITNNITVKDFGHEDIGYLSKEFLTICFKNRDMVSLLENIHCDREHPENHTIRLRSQKRKQIELRVNGRWKVHDETEALKDCINNGYRILCKHGRKHKKELIEEELDDEFEYDDINDWLEKLYDDDRYQKPIKRQLIMLLLSNQMLLLGKDE
jgi:hypothetical protein